MDTKLKAKWVKALRSGKYAQTTYALKDAHGFCCLGVLQDIDPSIKQSRSGEALDESCGLSRAVQQKLAGYNDITNKSFKWIAAYIERRKSL